MRNLIGNASLALASSLATAILFMTASAPSAQPANPSTGTPSLGAPSVSAQSSAPVADAAVQVYQQNGPSVVNIASRAVVRSRFGPAQQTQGVGSGFILDADGRIVTNNHVVQDAAQLTVTFQDQTTVPAQLLGRDPDNDLAVIQVDPNATDDEGRPIRDRLQPITLGDSDQVRIGEQAIAIGSPLGLQQSVTAGIVSALRSPGEDSQVPGQQLDLLGGAVQTDAAINPGNSGGPLFNSTGQVIGVNTAILSQSGGNEGIGFAIPVNVVKRVVPELIENGRYAHPLIGVTSISLSAIGQGVKQQLGLPTNQKGLLVQEVSAGAAQAGIRGGTRVVGVGGDQLRVGGDIIVAVDGRPVATGGDLRAYVENTRRSGDTVVVTVLRDGQHVDLPVTLTERPAQ
jgi:S1-C subfamily serine protease